MKSREFQSGTSASHRRTSGDAPNLGNVSRVRDVEHRTGQLRRRRRGSRSNPIRKRVVLIWSAVLGAATLLIFALAFVFWLRPYLSRKPVELVINPGHYESDVRVVSKFPSPSREESLDLVKRAINNRDPEKIESLFRIGSATRDEILEFLSAAEQRDGRIEQYEWLSSLDAGGLLMEGVLVVSVGNEKPSERLALLTPDAKGNWKLDFEAYARTVTPSWQELEQGAEQAIVRAFVGPDSYYNGAFRDDKEWNCYAIASPDSEVLFRGYCRVGSPQAAAMARLFSEGRNLSRATLELKRAAEGDPRQFEIIRLLSPDWVVAEPLVDRS